MISGRDYGNAERPPHSWLESARLTAGDVAIHGIDYDCSLELSLVETSMLLVVDLVGGSAAGLLVDLGWEALGLSSSEKFFFSHLDGKHVVGQ